MPSPTILQPKLITNAKDYGRCAHLIFGQKTNWPGPLLAKHMLDCFLNIKQIAYTPKANSLTKVGFIGWLRNATGNQMNRERVIAFVVKVLKYFVRIW